MHRTETDGIRLPRQWWVSRSPRSLAFAALSMMLAAACSGPGCRASKTQARDAADSSEPRVAKRAPSAASATPPAPEHSELARSDPPASVPEQWPSEPRRIDPDDVGVFEELTDQVRLRHPSWLDAGPAIVLRHATNRFVLVDGTPIAFAAGGEGPGMAARRLQDADADGIPNQLDLLIGAKKTVLNRAEYRSSYHELDYPMGDVPRGEGVCTDVIVRALRNAGFDLQKLLADDIAAHPDRYPMVEKADPNIDQRRVRTLLPYFEQHWQRVPENASPLLPGDICFMDTVRGPEPEHMGIVSDSLGPSGKPLIINNWNDGTKTAEMDLLGFVPITHRFRPPKAFEVHAPDRGLEGLLGRRGLSVASKHRQLVLVTVPTWDSSAGQLRRYERQSDGRLARTGAPIDVRIGQRGLGRGRGLHGASALRGLAPKQEGDRKAPAGLFALGTAFGPQEAPPYEPALWPWRRVGPRDRFVDDPESPLYNTWRTEPRDGQPDWSSAEKLSMYELGLVVEHNTDPAKPGAGSAIFLHTWSSSESTTIGCTAFDRRDLTQLLGWLEPEANPVLVQVAGTLL